MIPRYGYVVRETVHDTYGIFKANLLGVMLSNVLLEYTKEDAALRVCAVLNLEREFGSND